MRRPLKNVENAEATTYGGRREKDLDEILDSKCNLTIRPYNS